MIHQIICDMKFRGLILLIACLFLLNNSNLAQNLFSKVYAEYYNEYLSSSIISLNDGSVVISGIHDSKNLIMRIDADGELLWGKDMGYGYYESGAMCNDDDSTFVVAASVTTEVTDFYNLFCFKMTENGDTLWTRTYNFYEDVNVKWIDKTTDSGFIIAGHLGNDEKPYTYILVVKVDNEGNYLWSKTLSGGNLGNKALAADQSSADSAYYITGSFMNSDPYESFAYLMKIDSDGQLLFTKTYSNTEHNYSNGNGLMVTEEGVLMIITAGPNCFMKTDFSGEILWKNGGYESGYQFCGYDLRKYKIIEHGNNKYKFLSGDFVYETDSIGNIDHSMIFDMCGSDFTSVNGMTIVSGNGPMYGVRQNPYPQIGLINYDSLYQTSEICVWESSYYNFDVDISMAIKTVNEISHEVQAIIYQPSIASCNPDNEDKCVAFFGSISENDVSSFSVYPNPVRDQIFIHTENNPGKYNVCIIDINGKVVYSQQISGNSNTVNLDNLNNGVYNLRIITETAENHMIIIQK